MPSSAEFDVWTGYRIPDDRAEWHPLVRRLYDYWLSICPPGRLPGREHFAAEEIAPLWSRLWMIDVARNPLRYRYRLCGTDMVRALGREVTGRWFDEVHPELPGNSEVRERLRYTAETGTPTWRRGPPLWTGDPDCPLVESCIVPLAADGRNVDKMIGVVLAFDGAGRET